MNAHSLQPVLDFVLHERGWAPSPHLARLAAQLPAVACAGFEFALDRGNQIDLQQRVKGPAERARLQSFLKHNPPAEAEGPWTSLLRFCDLEQAAELADELWLELDDDPARKVPPLSIFARLPEAARADRSPDRSEVAIGRLLAAFATQLSSPARHALRRCLAACRDGAGVSHIGMMLGRSHGPLRLIVDNVAADDFAGFLDRAGLGSMAVEVQSRADALFVYADRIRLALTLTDHLHDVVGLECFVGDPTRHEPRWQPLLEFLARSGHCTPDRYQRLIDWPAQILPHRARQGWPGVLIAQALGEGAERLSWLDCRISHIKLTVGSDAAVRAKAYIGFVQETRDLRSPPEQAAKICSPGVQPSARHDALVQASDALLGARAQAGWWLDYPGFGEGLSDEWVTAYVAHACADIGTPPLRAAAERAWSLLQGRPRDGWGWNGVQPADADSTAWALRLAQALGRLGDPRAQQGLAFLARHIAVDGGVATYLPDSHACFPDLVINAEWHRAHLCVTAAVAGLAPLAEAPLACLRRAQQADGAWPGYWWADRAYATATAATALTASSAATPCAAARRAAHWAVERLAGDAGLRGDPFALALVLRTALLLPDADRALLKQGAADLAAAQRPDGLWPGSALLRIPNGAGDVVEATDRHGVFTTATVLQTLSAMRNAGHWP